MKQIYIGIDNGISGGIAVVDHMGVLHESRPLPVVSDGKKDRISAVRFSMLLDRFIEYGDDATVVVERPAGSKSVLAAVSMQDSFAKIETVLALGGYRHCLVTAKQWQKNFWTVPAMPKGRTFDTKAAALLAANRLWPGATWLASPRCRTPHDGMVDAALIAEYARQKRF